MKQLPLDFQWALLDRRHKGLASLIKTFLSNSQLEIEVVRANQIRVDVLATSFRDSRQFNNVMAFDREGNRIYQDCFAYNPDDFSLSLNQALFLGLFTFGGTIFSYVHSRKPEVRESVARNKNYNALKKDLSAANMQDIDTIVSGVKVYSSPFSVIRRNIGDMNRKLELVDTGKPYSYLVEDGEFLLRARAGLLGANAVTDFSEREYKVESGRSFNYDDQSVKTRRRNVKCSIGIPVFLH